MTGAISGLEITLHRMSEIEQSFQSLLARSQSAMPNAQQDFQKILEKTGISPDLRTDDLTEDDIRELRNALSEFNIEGDLRREVTMNIKRLQEINSFRGMRHKRGLPCRGQRTKTNARTRRGKKTGPIAGKKK